MARYKIVLAYDGTGFQGFQRQRNARTVQGVVEDALRRLGWQGRSVLAAGRTDTGVHASGQVIAFDLDWDHPSEDLHRALNALLPMDTAAVRVSLAPADFHPRYDATWRSYRYHIFSAAGRDPLRERFAWRVWPPLSPERLVEAAALLPGRHDFAAFGSPPKAGGSTIRTVLAAGWVQNTQPSAAGLFEAEWVFEIAAHAFLYHMVRSLVSIQVQIGQGQRSLEDLRSGLQREQSSLSLGLAPAQGLVLTKVCYSEEQPT